MKIWGPAPPRRLGSAKRQAGDVAGGAEVDPELVCGECKAIPSSCAGPFCADPLQHASGSDGARRAVARIRQQPPVDLVLEAPPLCSAADVRAVVAAASGSGGASLRTLTLGPWGSGGAAAPCGDCCAAEALEDAEMAAQALASQWVVWSRWPLRSFTVRDMRLQGSETLSGMLSPLPSSVSMLRLAGLALGPQGWLRECVEPLRHLSPGLRLDLSDNGLNDGDVAHLVADLLLGPEGASSGLALGGLSLAGNSAVTATGLRSLLCPALLPRLAALGDLDLSECNLGMEGARLLADSAQAMVGLRDLVLYRSGLQRDGVLLLISAAARMPALRSLNVVANGQHAANWMASVGVHVAEALRTAALLHVLTISCPEAELEPARRLLCGTGGACRVILVPNEQNNYNRPLFAGHVH